MSQTSEDKSSKTFSVLEHLENPYPLFKELREQDEIVFSPELLAWVVTRYEDMRSILAQPDIFSSRNLIPPTQFTPAMLEILQQGYPIVPVSIDSDGINHLRFRAPHIKGFSASGMKVHEDAFRSLANRLVDTFIDDHHVEIISQFTYPFALENILYLLGVPQDQMEQVKQWCRDMTDLFFNHSESEEQQMANARGYVAFQHYINTFTEERRANPKNDELNALITYQLPGEEPLSQLELVNAITALLAASHRSTLDAFGNGFALLLQTPSLWQSLCEQPDLIPLAVEEMLRFDTSTQTISRVATQDVEFRGVKLPEGARILIFLGSANHDERQFPDADTFNIHRESNRHAAFGHGIHFCVGASAARMELRIGLETLIKRLPGLRLSPNQTLTHNPLLIFRGYQTIEAEW